MKDRTPFDYDDKNTPVANHVSPDNTRYVIMRDGSRRRTQPVRTYRGKSQRRQVIAARRA